MLFRTALLDAAPGSRSTSDWLVNASIATDSQMLKQSDTVSLATHPDELIQWLTAQRTDPDIRLVGSPFLERALRDAAESGVVWTPVLDLLARRAPGAWLEDGRLPWVGEQIRAIEARAGELEPTAAVEALRVFRSSPIRVAILENVTTMTDELVRVAMSFSECWGPVLSRRDLTTSQCELALRLLLDPENGEMNDWANFRQDALARRLVYHQSNPGVSRTATAVRAAVETHGPLPRGLVARATEIADQLELGGSSGRFSTPPRTDSAAHLILAADASTSPDRLLGIIRSSNQTLRTEVLMARHQTLEFLRTALDVLKESGSSDLLLSGISNAMRAGKPIPERLWEVLDEVEPNILDDNALEIAGLPAVPRDIMRRIATRSSKPGLLDALARDARWRHDDVIRTRLLRCRTSSILSELIRDCGPKEFDRLWARLLRTGPETALVMIEQDLLPPHAVVTSESLAPILTKAGPEVALRAIMIAEKLKPKCQPDTPVRRGR